MRVACIGNMNNNLFTLTRYLRDAGVDAHLLVLNTLHAHFEPFADTYDLSYQAYTTHLDWGDQPGFRASTSRCRDDLEPYSFLIGCEHAPAFVDRIGRRLDIFMPCGDDILVYPFQKISLSRFPLTNYLMTKHQAQGIRSARSLVIGPNKINEETVRRLGCTGMVSNTITPLIHDKTYSLESIAFHAPRTHWYQVMKDIRERHDIVVLHHSRQDWRGNSLAHHCKANDVLIRGFANYVCSTRNKTAALVLVEYGRDVRASKDLIRELGIERNVFWLPLMFRKDLMPCISLIDIGCGEFRFSTVISGSISEVLALDKPLLTYRDDERHLDIHPELYPIMRANTPEQVGAALSDYAARPEYYAQMGRLGAAWHRTYAIEKSISFVLDQIRKSHDSKVR